MEIFRICPAEHAKTLSSSGSANRWNYAGEFVIYAGASRSLASLELVVHKSSIKPDKLYKVMIISAAEDDFLFEKIQKSKLPTEWRRASAYPLLQQLGSEWISSQKSLLLEVPSAVIPFESNYIINTRHPMFESNIKLVRTEDYFWDSRLLS